MPSDGSNSAVREGDEHRSAMVQPDIRRILNEYGDGYLVLDMGCLFVATTLREEIWLYRGAEAPGLLNVLCRQTSRFHIRDVNPDRNLFTYSGGEQAILASLLVLTLVEGFNLRNLNLLMHGVLESLSLENRRRLTRRFKAARRRGFIRPHVLVENRVHPL